MWLPQKQNTTSFRTDALSWLVLDEADRLMDLGFESKVKEIVTTLDARNASLEDHDGGRGSGSSPAAAGYGQQRRQTVLLSATLPPALGAFARQLMRPGAAAVGFSAAALNDPDAAAQLEQDTLEGGDAGAEEGAGAGGGGGLPQKAAATASAGPEKFEIPSQLRQAFVEVPAKLRLAALVAALRARLSPRRGGGGAAAVAKIVVFFSNCASVEFHHALLTRCSGGNGGGGGGGEDSDEDDGGGGVGGLLPVAPLKLHGDLPQAERTSNMLRFAKVSVCVCVGQRGVRGAF
jgi:superfamily II DNA/RNA helicase